MGRSEGASDIVDEEGDGDHRPDNRVGRSEGSDGSSESGSAEGDEEVELSHWDHIEQLTGVLRIPCSDHLTYRQLFTRYEGLILHEWQMHSQTHTLIASSNSDGKTKLGIHDFSPPHRALWLVAEEESIRHSEETGSVSIEGASMADFKAAILGS